VEFRREKHKQNVPLILATAMSQKRKSVRGYKQGQWLSHGEVTLHVLTRNLAQRIPPLSRRLVLYIVSNRPRRRSADAELNEYKKITSRQS
jgi:hypothetical protein